MTGSSQPAHFGRCMVVKKGVKQASMMISPRGVQQHRGLDSQAQHVRPDPLKRAVEAANGQDVRLGGGVATIQEYLRARLIDEMHVAIAPILLGSGEHLMANVNLMKLGYQCAEHVPTPNATHMILEKNERSRHNQ